jgi:AraC-like DNA-binding protein
MQKEFQVKKGLSIQIERKIANIEEHFICKFHKNNIFIEACFKYNELGLYQSYYIIWIDISKSYLDHFEEIIPFKQKSIELNHSSLARNIMTEILDCKFEGFFLKMFIEQKVLELLIFISNNKENHYDNKAIKEIHKIELAYQILQDNIDKRITIAWLCKKLGINKTYLVNGFKNRYKTSIRDFIKEERMQKAAFWLANSDISIQLISDKLSYSNLSNFSNAFNTYFGLFPKEYREKHFKNY